MHKFSLSIKFLFVLVLIAGISMTALAQDTELVAGETITVDPAAGDSTTFTFEGEAGTAINIFAVSSNSEDTQLVLLDASGTQLATDADSGGNLNPYLRRFSLPETGTYTVSIEAAYTGTPPTMAFDITLEETEVLSLNEEQTHVMGSELKMEAFALEVEADTSYMLTIAFDEAGDWPMFVNMFTETDTLLPAHQISLWKADGGALFFTPAATGTLRVIVQYDDYTGGESEITFNVETID